MMIIKWKEELQNKNIEEMWVYIFKYFDTNVETSMYQRRLGRRKKNPCGWIVQHIKHKKRKTYQITDIYKKFKTERRSRNNYKEALNYYTKEARRSKEKFERKLALEYKE